MILYGWSVFYRQFSLPELHILSLIETLHYKMSPTTDMRNPVEPLFGGHILSLLIIVCFLIVLLREKHMLRTFFITFGGKSLSLSLYFSFSLSLSPFLYLTNTLHKRLHFFYA